MLSPTSHPFDVIPGAGLQLFPATLLCSSVQGWLCPFKPPPSLQNVVENDERVDYLPLRFLLFPGYTYLLKTEGLRGCCLQ